MQLLPLGHERFAIVDDVDADLASSKWHARKQPKTFYARRAPSHNVHEDLHRVIAKRMGIVGAVDHRNRHGLDCTRGNLRAATKSQNAANTGLRRTNTSGYIGVCAFYGRSDRRLSWQVTIGVNGKQRKIGYSKDIIEAARMYDAAAREAFGEFASLNFP